MLLEIDEARTTAVVTLAKRQGVAAPDVLLGCLTDWDPPLVQNRNRSARGRCPATT